MNIRSLVPHKFIPLLTVVSGFFCCFKICKTFLNRGTIGFWADLLMPEAASQMLPPLPDDVPRGGASMRHGVMPAMGAVRGAKEWMRMLERRLACQ